MTWISGNAVAPGFASCANASPDAHSNSDAEPDASNDRFVEDDMVLILKPVANDPAEAAVEAAIFGINNDRCQEAGGARGWKARWPWSRWTNSASVAR